MNIFIPVVGQFTNIGDVLHRRQLLSWVKDSGQLHIYVGNAPSSFIEGLELEKSVVLYTSLSKWFWAIIKSGYKKTAFIFNPGEIKLGKRRLKGELLLFPLLLLVRLKSGVVLRVGIAAMSNSKKSNLWLWKFLFKTTSKVYWRTFHSQELFGRGNVIPDLAFYDIEQNMPDKDNRDSLTLSMRVDRKFPSEAWFEAIKRFADSNQLKVNVVSQVRADNQRTIEIANKLKAIPYPWPDDITHLQQEKIVNDLYLKTQIVISDRLHVLIAAYSKGALPANILSAQSEKVQHHFSVIGLEDVSILETENSVDQLVYFLENKIAMREDILSKLDFAKQNLEKTKVEIQQLLRK